LKAHHSIIICLLISFLTQSSHGQAPEVALEISAGAGNFLSNDKLINSYTYQAVSPRLLQVNTKLRKGTNHFEIIGSAYQANGQPVHYNSLLYNYNQMHFQYYALEIKYLRQIARVKDKLNFELGLGYQTYGSFTYQRFQSRLYDAGTGYRKSYIYSPAGLNLQLIATYQLNSKNRFQLKGAYGLMSEIARPEDDYVKQLGLNTSPQWRYQTFLNYTSYQLELKYAQQIIPDFGLSVALQSQYLNVRQEYAQQFCFLLFGIEKQFR
jgi:hypothetical protein